MSIVKVSRDCVLIDHLPNKDSRYELADKFNQIHYIYNEGRIYSSRWIYGIWDELQGIKFTGGLVGEINKKYDKLGIYILDLAKNI